MSTNKTSPEGGIADLARERSSASFPVSQMFEYLSGGKENAAKVLKLQQIIEKDPSSPSFAAFEYRLKLLGLESKETRPFLSREDFYKRGLQSIARMQELRREHDWNDDDYNLFYALAGEETPLPLQIHVFIPCLKALASEEQLAKWLPKARSYEIIGCYAQTELAHGSNVAGIETTATYIPETDELELHTPHANATKWWVGQMGLIATHCVVFAQLIIGGKNLGPHPFMVQLRSLDTHTPLKGIHVGDIGPKMGMSAVDNGYLRLEHVRIPRKNLLSRYFSIEKGGKYTAPPHSKLAYGSMLAVRMGLLEAASRASQLAATVAVRYSCVRRQFSDGPTSEKQIIDHKMQQYRVLPLIANAYALHFVHLAIGSMFKQMNKEFADGQFGLLAPAHASSSGLKGYTTTIAAEGLEEARRACGGHGYSQSSGLPQVYQTFTHVQTAEGENYLLTQQTTRHLLKILQAVVTGTTSSIHPQDPAVYLAEYDTQRVASEKCSVAAVEDWSQEEHLIGAFNHRAARLVQYTARKLQNEISARSPAAAWNEIHIEALKCSKAHCQAITVSSFFTGIAAAASKYPQLFPQLKNLAELFALYNLEKEMGEFLEDGYLSQTQLEMARERFHELMASIRPDAVALVDSFGLSDATMASQLGRKDGDVYANLLRWVSRNPMNQLSRPPGFDEYIRPLWMNHAKL